MTRWVSEAEFAVFVECLVVRFVYPVRTGIAVNTFQKVADVFTTEDNCNKNKEFMIRNETGYDESEVKEDGNVPKFGDGGKEFPDETVRREFLLEVDFEWDGFVEEGVTIEEFGDYNDCEVDYEENCEFGFCSEVHCCYYNYYLYI